MKGSGLAWRADPAVLSRQISSCLFRFLRYALHNLPVTGSRVERRKRGKERKKLRERTREHTRETDARERVDARGEGTRKKNKVLSRGEQEVGSRKKEKPRQRRPRSDRSEESGVE